MLKIFYQKKIISEDFYLFALEWEKDPLILWYLIKNIGERQLICAFELLINIGLEPDKDFESDLGTKTSLHRIAAWAIGEMPLGKAHIKRLLELCYFKDEVTRIFAIDTLGEYGKPDLEILKALEIFLLQEVLTVALWSALSLSKIGLPALPILHEGLFNIKKQDAQRIAFVFDAIVKIGDNSSYLILKEYFKNISSELEDLFLMITIQNNLHLNKS